MILFAFRYAAACCCCCDENMEKICRSRQMTFDSDDARHTIMWPVDKEENVKNSRIKQTNKRTTTTKSSKEYYVRN